MFNSILYNLLLLGYFIFTPPLPNFRLNEPWCQLSILHSFVKRKCILYYIYTSTYIHLPSNPSSLYPFYLPNITCKRRTKKWDRLTIQTLKCSSLGLGLLGSSTITLPINSSLNSCPLRVRICALPMNRKSRSDWA
jgi:hypothetical protein